MRISTLLQYAGNPRRAADSVVALEAAGLDVVWVAEAWGFDSPTLMGYLAAKTETVQIGSAIINVFSRTPALIAQTAAGLDNVSGGRAILGIGASGPQVIEGWHGVPYDRPLARTREVIEIVREALTREALAYDGRVFSLPLPPGQGTGLGKSLRLLNRPEREQVPIYVAALGAKSVESTAEVADGWFPFPYLPERAAGVWGAALETGRARRLPGLGPLEVVAGGMVAIGDDVEGLLDLARPQFALYIGGMGAKGRNFYHDIACRYGFEAEADAVQEAYLAGRAREAELLVPRALLEACNLVGPEGYVRERIAAFRESGVTMLNVTPLGPDPVGVVRRLKEWTA